MKNDIVENVFVITLGCSKNVVDSENLLGALKASGFNIAEDLNKADAVMINTCGFIGDSKEESVQTVFEVLEMKRRGMVKKVIVFGCFVQRYAEDLKAQIPVVDGWFGITPFEEIVKTLKGTFYSGAKRELITAPHTAFLKISEGCDHGCAFCAIPLIRGKHISREMDGLISEAKELKDRSVKELVVIAQDTTNYGKDLYGERKLPDLLRRLSDLEFPWIKLLYTYPVGFPLETIKVMAERENICNYLDMPLQHASDKVLKSMGRGSTKDSITGLLDDIRGIIPDITLRSTFIVGYPTESKSDFEILHKFIKEQKFDRVGAFRYSPEEGTSGFELGDKIGAKEKLARLDKLMLTQQEISLEKNEAKVGSTILVLTEGMEDGSYYGRSAADAPEVDNSVFFSSEREIAEGEFVQVEIESAEEYDLFGIAK